MRVWVVAAGGCLLAATVTACGDDDGPSVPDATTDGGRETPAEIPWLVDGAPPIAAPMLGPCPTGWHEVASADGPTTCEPYPKGGALDCPDGQAHFPGGAGCEPVGSTCPTGDYSESLPSDRRVVYVQSGATGGDGASPSSAYGSLREFSIGGLSAGSVIALSRGTHFGTARLVREVVLQGACAADTALTTSTPADGEGVVTLENASGGLRDLSILSSPRPGIWIERGAGAGVAIVGVVVSDVEDAGAAMFDDVEVTAEGLVVEGTRPRMDDGTFGRGLIVESGAGLSLTRALLDANHDAGLTSDGDGTVVTLREVAVRDTEARIADGANGRGLVAEGGARIDAANLLIAGNRDVGTVIHGLGTHVSWSHVVVRDTSGRQSDGHFGRGVVIAEAARAELAHTVVERSRGVGIAVSLPDASAALTDVVVRDTLGRDSDATRGRGLNVQRGAVVEVSRALFFENRDLALFAHAAGTSVTLIDTVVRNTDGDSTGSGGRGLNTQSAAFTTAERVLLEGNRDLGVFVDGADTSATLVDLVVRDTESRADIGEAGRGLSVQGGALAELTRALLERNRDVGVLAEGEGTVAILADVVVRDTRGRACGETSCSEDAAGHGVGSVDMATLTMTRFDVSGAALCGLQLARGGEMDLSNGAVHGHPIGACIQVDGFDIGRLTTDVPFFDNDVNLDATTLPVPEAAEEADEA